MLKAHPDGSFTLLVQNNRTNTRHIMKNNQNLNAQQKTSMLVVLETLIQAPNPGFLKVRGFNTRENHCVKVIVD